MSMINQLFYRSRLDFSYLGKISKEIVQRRYSTVAIRSHFESSLLLA
jgi:hypothetical protein